MQGVTWKRGGKNLLRWVEPFGHFGLPPDYPLSLILSILYKRM